ncbi:MAG: heme o synthase [Verrucomicrobia bacterium]|nr:heme o synthase [Verrucomicrobiota bacterium]
MLKTYYLLTKPGIILGNLITTVGGFALASRGGFDWTLFLFLTIGLGGVIGSACVFNNYIDRESDRKMERTKNRALARGVISGKSAVLFAMILGTLGFSALIFFTNWIATLLAAVGYFIYVGMYSFWKHQTRYATLVGSVSGAVPPVIGYVAASHQLDLSACVLFAILVLWQMPHFYSIAMWKMDDYRAASVPVLPLVQGIGVTKVHMLLYIAAFLCALLLLPLVSTMGSGYLMALVPLSLAWGGYSLKGFTTHNDQHWARQMFRLSLVIILVFSALISFP